MAGCANQYPNSDPTGQMFPSVSGKTLSDQTTKIPDDFLGQPALLLLGYVQNAQFDIDRWLIGLDMSKADIETYEIPAIQGFWPGLFKEQIDNGMRAGIPEELWSIVITLYDDGEQVQRFTGNMNPNNARVVLVDSTGMILHFYDRGFSVDALNQLNEKISKI